MNTGKLPAHLIIFCLPWLTDTGDVGHFKTSSLLHEIFPCGFFFLLEITSRYWDI